MPTDPTPTPGTPLPWRFSQDRTILWSGCVDVAVLDRPVGTEDAAYIVHACNSLPALAAERDRLREALGKCVAVLRALHDGLPAMNEDDDDPDSDGQPGTDAVEVLCEVWLDLKAALAAGKA